MKTNILLLFLCLVVSNVYGQIGYEEYLVSDDDIGAYGGRDILYEDINGDGFKDIVNGNSIFINQNGVVDFENFIDLKEFHIKLFQLLDVDNDGDIDVLYVHNSADDEVRWIENMDGQGTFVDVHTLIDFNFDIESLEIGDVDGDNDLDIVIGSHDSEEIIWYINEGGDFETSNIIIDDIYLLFDLKLTDVNLDGDLDIVVFGYQNIGWFENIDGLGTFSELKIISSPNQFLNYWFEVEDVDGDSFPDIIYASTNSNSIKFIKNNNGLDFGSVETIISLNEQAQFVRVLDIDLDGDMDIIGCGLNSINLFENLDGNELYGEAQIITTDVYFTVGVLCQDLDGDGLLDVYHVSHGKIVWHKNEGNGVFASQKIISQINTMLIKELVDFDNDGDVDIIGYNNGLQLSWYENLDGAGNFGPQHSLYTFSESCCNQMVFEDIDLDGDTDIIVIKEYGVPLSVLEVQDGEVISIQEVDPSFAGGINIIYKDLDGDNHKDIVSFNDWTSKVYFFKNIDGTFDFEPGVEIYQNGSIDDFIFEDIDSDGDEDLVLYLFSSIFLLTNDGNGNFTEGGNLIENIFMDFVSFFDIDLDGDIDCLIKNFNGFEDNIEIYENNGLGNFSLSYSIESEQYTDYYIIDLDEDGDLDLIDSNDGITWYENINGVFSLEQSIFEATYDDLFFQEINGDSKQDIVCRSDDNIYWLENIGQLANTIKGNVILDEGADGCDDTDTHLADILVTAEGTNSFSQTTNASGYFELNVNEGSFNTSIQDFDNFTSTPSVHTSNFTGIYNVDSVDFCLTPSTVVNDLNISIVPLGTPRPGVEVTYRLVYNNVGTTVLDGNIDFEFIGSLANFVSASATPVSQTANTLAFEFVGLQPLGTAYIDVVLMIEESAQVDDTWNLHAIITPDLNDPTDDNQFTLNQVIVNSYDPNDITCLEGNEVLIQHIDRYLHYVIRFQNTGTAPAINVRVENELDDKLDWSTFKLESSSHMKSVEIEDGNKVKFFFYDINLPDSTTNLELSQGFIAYKIKLKDNVTTGEIVYNTAEIFFDFNEPVVTNTYETIIISIIDVDDINTLDFTVYPTPTRDQLNIETESNIESITIYDNAGALVLKTQGQKAIDISSLASGSYICKVMDEDGKLGVQKIVKL